MTGSRRRQKIPMAASVTVTWHRSEYILTLDGMISNISLSGIGLYFDNSLERGALVSIVINFMTTDGFMKKDSMEGKIVHTNKIEDLYYAGIEFNAELSEIHQPLLFEHLQTIL